MNKQQIKILKQKITKAQRKVFDGIAAYGKTTIRGQFKYSKKLTETDISDPNTKSLFAERRQLQKQLKYPKSKITGKMLGSSKQGQAPRASKTGRSVRQLGYAEVSDTGVKLSHISGKAAQPYEFGGVVSIYASKTPKDWLRIDTVDGQDGQILNTKKKDVVMFVNKFGKKQFLNKLKANIVQANKKPVPTQVQIKPRPFLAPAFDIILKKVPDIILRNFKI